VKVIIGKKDSITNLIISLITMSINLLYCSYRVNEYIYNFETT